MQSRRWLPGGKDGAKARHRKRVAGLSADQAMVIANFVKGLKETERIRSGAFLAASPRGIEAA